jgi:hypothetical protein
LCFVPVQRFGCLTPYRDEVVGVFVRFRCAASLKILMFRLLKILMLLRMFLCCRGAYVT